jgi:membrane protein YqaA with SNARE-associated domain
MALVDIFISYGMIGLLIISIISSIIPIPSEPVVFGLLGIGGNPELIFLILTFGSIFGAYISYYVGKHELTKIIKIGSNKYQEETTQNYFRKHSVILLLISPWIPVFVNVAPLVAGIENYNVKRFLFLISIANIIKSTGVVYLSISVINWLTTLFMK